MQAYVCLILGAYTHTKLCMLLRVHDRSVGNTMYIRVCMHTDMDSDRQVDMHTQTHTHTHI